MHRYLSAWIDAFRGTHRSTDAACLRRTSRLRLETLEGRDVPASPITTGFSGSLKDGVVDHYSFPPLVVNFTEIPSGSKIQVKFGASPDPSGQHKAKVELKDSKKATVKSATVSLTNTKTIITYTVPKKSPLQWEVVVQSVGKSLGGFLWPYSGSAILTLPDISVSSATYTGGDESAHKNPTGVKATVATSKDFKDPFKVELFRSKDGKNPSGSALAQQTVTPSGGSTTVTLDTGKAIKGTKDQPFLVVVADKDEKVPEDNEKNNTKSLDLPFVTLQPKSLTLMKPDKLDVSATGSGASSYKVEVREQGDGDSDYVVAGTGASSPVSIVPRLATEVEYLASVKASGGRFFGEPTAITVEFPDVGTIAGDGAVKSNANALWEATLAYAQGNAGLKWHELGAFVLLNTDTGKYSFSSTITGPDNTLDATGAPQQAGIAGNVFVPPDDEIFADQTGIYVVASFHTHPPDHLAAGKDLYHPVGASGYNGTTGGDAANAAALGLPGLVYDYVGNPGPLRDGFGLVPNPNIGSILIQGNWIQGGWKLNSAAKMSTYGPNKRTR